METNIDVNSENRILYTGTFAVHIIESTVQFQGNGEGMQQLA